MKILIGLAMVVVGSPVAWWAFNKAVSGQDFYNWIWVPAMVVATIGILTVIAQIGLWMRS
jgi:uncharacterized membrane protein